MAVRFQNISECSRCGNVLLVSFLHVCNMFPWASIPSSDPYRSGSDILWRCDPCSHIGSNGSIKRLFMCRMFSHQGRLNASSALRRSVRGATPKTFWSVGKSSRVQRACVCKLDVGRALASAAPHVATKGTSTSSGRPGIGTHGDPQSALTNGTFWTGLWAAFDSPHCV